MGGEMIVDRRIANDAIAPGAAIDYSTVCAPPDRTQNRRRCCEALLYSLLNRGGSFG